jgi:DNA-binding MarR family transcriptional regulator
MLTNKSIQEKNIDVAFGYLILRSARLLRYNFTTSFKAAGFDLSPEQWVILNKLSKKDGVTQVALTDTVFNDKSNITRIIDSLEKKGYVVRRKDDTDRRAMNIFLTKLAEEKLPLMWECALEVRKIVYKDLTDEDIQSMQRISGILERNILRM